MKYNNIIMESGLNTMHQNSPEVQFAIYNKITIRSLCF
jgi:hypothetical protein